jgi:hypothetical protein
MEAGAVIKEISSCSGQTGCRSNQASELVHGGDLTYRIIGLAMRVHRHLGPGLPESVYQTCLAFELARNNIRFRRQVTLPVVYDQVYLNPPMPPTLSSPAKLFWKSGLSNACFPSTKRNC